MLYEVITKKEPGSIFLDNFECTSSCKCNDRGAASLGFRTLRAPARPVDQAATEQNRGQPNLLNYIGVITSYSIHYTKLYEGNIKALAPLYRA